MEYLDTIFSAIGAVAAIIATVIAAKTLTDSRKEQAKGLAREKRQATLDAYNRLQEQVFDKLNMYKPADIRTIAEEPRSDGYKIISAYLARIEHFCVGLETDIYDYETFYALAHGYFDSEKGILKPRLLPMLTTKLDGAGTDYFANLHAVWKKMDEMSESR